MSVIHYSSLNPSTNFNILGVPKYVFYKQIFTVWVIASLFKMSTCHLYSALSYQRIVYACAPQTLGLPPSQKRVEVTHTTSSQLV